MPLARTLGPITDLERHLPSEWWRTLFNSIYLKTDGDVVENDGNTLKEVDLLVSHAGLEKSDRILDLCCGQGRHCIELARRGFTAVTGIDRSRYLVRLARKRARSLGLNITFKEGDARRFQLPPASFDCVALMGNSFGYFDREEDDLAVLTAVRETLASEGAVILDIVDGTWMKDHFERRSWEWIDQSHFVCRERSLAADQRRIVSREVVVHAERGVIADQFYAERLYTEASIRELLEAAGFRGVRLHGKVNADSDRGQDLGMMAHRLFIGATAPRRAKLPPPGPVRARDVTVLLGDPRLPDSVKLEGQFNEADIDTVRKLQRACAEVSGYRFEYFDEHAKLLDRLRNRPPKFVLNLCDEGFRNDAFFELHVAALLEMFGIPYSGAGPQALALCYNKNHVRAIADSLEIPVPGETFVDPDDHLATIPATFPALVKPNYGDSSVGITARALVNNSEELVAYLNEVRTQFPGRPILVQEFLSGGEYTVGLVGNPGMTMTPLPIMEVDYSRLDPGLPPILGYESKWDPASPYWTQLAYREAQLDEDTQRRLVDASTLLFERLGCRDYARFDFRADANGVIKLLEVNPNPGWCWDGKMNIMAGMAGYRYPDFLKMILDAAFERYTAGTATGSPNDTPLPVESLRPATV
ncbi:MAG: methyltransferase domain-containing protein [Candidatus Sumerlaeia bacterium]|nr:methyltransferase domain-containing protein [Candidatus Sumerlaeia bacterium]